MLTAPSREIEIARFQPWLFEVGYPGANRAADTFSFEARENEGTIGAAGVSLAMGNGADGITVTVTQVDGQPYTTVSCRLSRASVDALPAGVPVGSDVTWFYGFKCNGVEHLQGRAIITAKANHI